MAVFKNKELEAELQYLKERNQYLEYHAQPEIRESDALQVQLNALQDQVSKWQASLSQYQTAVTNNQQLLDSLNNTIAFKQSQIVTFDDEILVQEFGLYQPRFSFTNSSQYKERLANVRARQKAKIKEINEMANQTTWAVNGSSAQGKKMAKDISRLLLRAYNSECDEVISKIKFSNIDASISKIRKSAEMISKLGSVLNIWIPYDYVTMKEEEAYLAYEYAQVKEQEKEALREERAREREERAVQKEIEAKRNELKREQKKYLNFLLDIRARLAENPDENSLKEKLLSMEETLEDIGKAIEDVDYREANKRAGYVYVISNIGSFGEGMFKIGMTRRLDPMERVAELGGASVPFKFDVHAMIFSDDAPALEAALHNEFEQTRVNLVNRRREFFAASLDEIKDVIKRYYDKTVDFTDVPDAEQYRVTLKMRDKQPSSLTPQSKPSKTAEVVASPAPPQGTPVFPSSIDAPVPPPPTGIPIG